LRGGGEKEKNGGEKEKKREKKDCCYTRERSSQRAKGEEEQGEEAKARGRSIIVFERAAIKSESARARSQNKCRKKASLFERASERAKMGGRKPYFERARSASEQASESEGKRKAEKGKKQNEQKKRQRRGGREVERRFCSSLLDRSTILFFFREKTKIHLSPLTCRAR